MSLFWSAQNGENNEEVLAGKPSIKITICIPNSGAESAIPAFLDFPTFCIYLRFPFDFIILFFFILLLLFLQLQTTLPAKVRERGRHFCILSLPGL